MTRVSFNDSIIGARQPDLELFDVSSISDDPVRIASVVVNIPEVERLSVALWGRHHNTYHGDQACYL